MTETVVVDKNQTVVAQDSETNVKTVVVDNNQTVVVQDSGTKVIVTGIMGPRGTTTIQALDDIDLSNLQNGSLLIYSTAASKWQASTLLDSQTLEAGQF